MKRGIYARKREDEKAVEELMSEAMDMVILEQVAAINNLPSPLQNRFHSTITTAEREREKCKCNNNMIPPFKKTVVAAKYWEQKEKKRENPKPIISRRGRRRSGFWLWLGCWRRESRERKSMSMSMEEEKICLEAEKVIKLVNLASAQMEMDTYMADYIHY